MIVRRAPGLVRLSLALGCALCATAVCAAKPITPSGLAANPPPLASTSPATPALTAEPQFDTVPSPLPANLPSLGFEATGTTEFGDLVHLRGVSHFIGSVTVTLSTGAVHSDFRDTSPVGFTHPITLTLYGVDRSGATPQPGAVLARRTEAFLIPWRAESGPSVLPGRAVSLTFDLGTTDLALPEELIFSLSFNTQHYGNPALGSVGPYNSLGVALTDRPATTSTDEADTAFWRTANAANYADGGAGGANRFRRDTGWLQLKPAVRFTNSLFGTLFELTDKLELTRGPDSTTDAAFSLAAGLGAFALNRAFWDGNNQLHPVLGRYVFDLLAEAADELTDVAAGSGPLADRAQHAIDTFLSITGGLAETAAADALIFGGDPGRIGSAQDAIDQAAVQETNEHYGNAIDHYAEAWREAQTAVR